MRLNYNLLIFKTIVNLLFRQNLIFMKKSILIALLICSSFSFSQTKSRVEIPKAGEVNVIDAMDSDWSTNLQNLEAPSPDGDSYRSYLLQKKQEIEANHPKRLVSKSSRAITAKDTLRVGKNFLSTGAGHGVPNDNSIAISNAGILVSAYNSAIFIRDTENDTTLGEISLDFFRNQVGLSGNSFDPKMIYDPEADRFILVFLSGNLIANSNIVVCFTETTNPMGNWNVYYLSGNPLSDSSWSDYPAISITNEDLFITMNLLNEGGSWQTSFKQTVIWQVAKAGGYNGDATINSDLWTDIKEGGINIRNMHTVRGGFDIKGPNQYFLSNRNFAVQSDSIYLIEVTNSLASNVSLINIQLLRADNPYYLASNARQLQYSFKNFQTNDSRVLGGIIENDEIQFVQNSLNPNNGYPSIYHGVISNVSSNPSVKGTILHDDSLEFGYPNIVYGGLIPGEKKSIIGFNHTGYWNFAGNSAVYFDGNNYSKIKEIKKGDNWVASMFGGFQRWGDYFGMQRKYNEPCKVWVSGYYGSASKDNQTWVSEIYAPGDCYDTITITPQQSGNLFPNPATDNAEIHFLLNESKFIIIDITDRNGKVIKRLYEDKAKAGENRLAFSTRLLSPGLYFVRIYNDNEKILTKKIVKYNE